jgi:hypothetical protein
MLVEMTTTGMTELVETTVVELAEEAAEVLEVVAVQEVAAEAVRREAEQEVAAEAGALEVAVVVAVLEVTAGLEAVSRVDVVGPDVPVELFPSARRIRYPSCFSLRI